MTQALPDFGKPPVVEVAVSLQFKPLELLRSAHIGLLWDVFRREGFKRTEDHGEIEPAFEEFEGKPTPRVGVKIQAFDDAPPLPRVWFLNDTQTELIQVQRDRLIVNWRQGANPEPYPRYESIIKRFRFALDVFTSFAKSQNLGGLSPTQCELTYVNHILPVKHSELSNTVTTWQDTYSDTYLPAMEDAAFRARYRMEDERKAPLGRLHISVQPAFRTTDGEPIFAINMTARGAPKPADLDGALNLFDREHEWIVRGFTSITTTRMHNIWERKNGN